MRKLFSLSVAAAAVAALFSGYSHAQSFESATVTASTNVPAQVCRFSSDGGSMTIGHGGGDQIDPLSSTPATGTAVVTYACGVQQPVEFSCLNSTGPTPCSTVWGASVPATPFEMSGMGGQLAASMALNGSGPGQGAGTPLNATITGSVQPAAFQQAPAGNYAGFMVFGIR